MNNKSTIIAYLSLGSNIDDRMAHLSAAIEKLDRHMNIKVMKRSGIYETEPWPLHEIADEEGHPHAEKGQMWFLNQVLQIETSLGSQELLRQVQSIESDIGRTNKHHWGPREIDIDILLYGNDVIESSDLEIPHRHMNDRQFVLMPLVELDSGLKDPVSGKAYKTILQNIKDDHKVKLYF